MKFWMLMLGLIVGLVAGQRLPRTFFRYWYDDVTIEEGDHVKFNGDMAKDINTQCKMIVKSLQATDSGNEAYVVFICNPTTSIQVFTEVVNQKLIHRVNEK